MRHILDGRGGRRRRELVVHMAEEEFQWRKHLPDDEAGPEEGYHQRDLVGWLVMTDVVEATQL